jgi:hypothetical protein
MSSLLIKIMQSIAFILLALFGTLALAENASDSFIDNITLGGYTSAIANLHPNGDKELSLHELSLFIGYDNNDRIRFFSEIELEDALTWKTKSPLSTNQAQVNIERFYFDYNLTEALNIRAGRFYNPIGRWNLIPADPLQWTTTRPLSTTRLFPQATNGVMLFGSKSMFNQAIEYNIYLEAIENNRKDRNMGEAIDTHGLHVQSTGNHIIGISVLEFEERIPVDAQFRVLGIDYLTKINNFELSAEAYQRFKSNGQNGGNGGYVQLVAPLGNDWYATGRLENVQIPQEGNTARWLLGAAWKLKKNQVFKVEYVGGNQEIPGSPKGLISSFSILF